MYCSNCGAEVPEESKFCPGCGASVEVNSMDSSAASSVPEPIMQVPQQTVTTETERKPGFLNWVLAVIVGVIAAYIVGAISAFIGEKFLVGSLSRDTLDMLRVGAIILGLAALWTGYSIVRHAGYKPETNKPVIHPVVQSGSPQFPSSLDAILFILDRYEIYGGEFATFSESDDRFVQVMVNGEIALNLSWPYRENPDIEFRRKGIHLPDGFVLSDMEPDSYAMYTGPLISKRALAETIDHIFVNIYGLSKGYCLSGSLE